MSVFENQLKNSFRVSSKTNRSLRACKVLSTVGCSASSSGWFIINLYPQAVGGKWVQNMKAVLHPTLKYQKARRIRRPIIEDGERAC